MCGQKDGICPNDFTATPICGIGSSPTRSRLRRTNIRTMRKLQQNSAGANLGPSCNVPTPTPHAPCPPSAHGSCVYADEDTGDHVACYTDGTSILRSTSNGAYGVSSPEWFTKIISGISLNYNVTLTCNGASNTWCTQGATYSSTAIFGKPGCIIQPSSCGSFCPQVFNYTMNSFGKPPIISAYGSVYGVQFESEYYNNPNCFLPLHPDSNNRIDEYCALSAVFPQNVYNYMPISVK